MHVMQPEERWAGGGAWGRERAGVERLQCQNYCKRPNPAVQPLLPLPVLRGRPSATCL